MNADKKFLTWRLAAGLAFLTAALAFRKPFRQYPGIEYANFPFRPITSRRPNGLSRG